MEVRKAGYSQTGDQAKGQSSQPKAHEAPSASKEPLTLRLTSECTGDNGSGGRKRFKNHSSCYRVQDGFKGVSSGAKKSA